MSWTLYADDEIHELVKQYATKRALAFRVVPKACRIRIQWGSIVRFLSTAGQSRQQHAGNNKLTSQQ